MSANIGYVVDVTRRNRREFLYLKGDVDTDGSRRFCIDADTACSEIQHRVDGVWQPASFEVGANTLWLGPNVGAAALGHHMATESADGHMHFHVHSEFDGEISITDAQIPHAYGYLSDIPIQPDESTEWSGTVLRFNTSPSSHSMLDKLSAKTGSVAATDYVRLIVRTNDPDTGAIILDQKYSASLFTANTTVALPLTGRVEFEAGTDFYFEYSSSATFSLKMNAAGDWPWAMISYSLMREDNLLQTRSWVDGYDWDENDYFIEGKKIHICNQDGIQTGTFAENSDKWSTLGMEHTQYWQRNGIILSPANAGDDIETSGKIRVTGGGIFLERTGNEPYLTFYKDAVAQGQIRANGGRVGLYSTSGSTVRFEVDSNTGVSYCYNDLRVSNRIYANNELIVDSSGDIQDSALPKSANWDESYSWGDHALVGYLTVETDPVFLSQKGANSGVATLDAGGKIPSAQLPNSVMDYKGTWNASTNTPTLADGTGNAGDVYICDTAGTQDLGSGNVTFAAGDWVIYDGSVWEKSINSDRINSVNGQTGTVVLDLDDIGDGITYGRPTFTKMGQWDTAYGWGDHAAEGYLTSYTETDPVFSAWDKSTGISIIESQISDLSHFDGDIASIYNSLGDLQIQSNPNNGNIDFFGGTDVANDENGGYLYIRRQAPEGNDYIRFYISSGRTAYIHSDRNLTLQGQINFTINSVTEDIIFKVGDNAGAKKVYFKDSDGSVVSSLDSNGNFTAEKIYLNDSGSDYIGWSAGDSCFRVTSGLDISGTLFANDISGGNWTGSTIDATDYIETPIIRNTDGDTVTIQDHLDVMGDLYVSGNAGFGTSDPDYVIHLYRTDEHSVLHVEAGGPNHGEANIFLKTQSDPGWQIFMDDSDLSVLGKADRLGFYHYGSAATRMVIDGSTGNVTITGLINDGVTTHKDGTTQQSNHNLWDCRTADYIQKFLVGTWGTGPHQILFDHSGTRMYVLDNTSEEINEFILTTPWDVSTAGYSTVHMLSGQAGNPMGMCFNLDGTKLYVCDSSSDSVYQYTLSSAWDLSTLAYASIYKDVSAYCGSPVSIMFKPDGLRCYINDGSSDEVEQWNLTTAWDISTASYSLQFDSQMDNIEGGAFSPDGARLYVVDGSAEDDIHEYHLSVPWDISTAVYKYSKDLTGIASVPNSIFFRPDGTKMYVTDNNVGNDSVMEFDLGPIGNVSFYGGAPVELQTGVAVSAAGIHAALVNLGLITA